MQLFAKRKRRKLKRRQSEDGNNASENTTTTLPRSAADRDTERATTTATVANTKIGNSETSTTESNSEFLAKVKAESASSTFATLKLRSWIVRNCQSLSLVHPTPVQYVCIPQVLAGTFLDQMPELYSSSSSSSSSSSKFPTIVLIH